MNPKTFSGILLFGILIGGLTGLADGSACVFCNQVEDREDNSVILYDVNGYPYRAYYPPDEQSEYGYYEDGTEIPCDVCSPPPRITRDRNIPAFNLDTFTSNTREMQNRYTAQARSIQARFPWWIR